MIGLHISEIDTPALCIDLDAMEANIAAMSEFITSRGLQWRPCVASHNCPDIAQLQLAAGAIGVTCGTVSEAASMVHAGIHDVLIAGPIVGTRKLQRIAQMCQVANPIVAVDHYTQAESLSRIAAKHNVRPRVVVEVDLGTQRTGTRPGADATRLYRGIAELPGIQPVGIMGREGHLQQIADPETKRADIREAMNVLQHTRNQILRADLCCDIVSAGATGTYETTSDCPGITEIQAGGIFADGFHLDHCGVNSLTPALTVATTIVSRPSLTRGIADAGRRAIAVEPQMPSLREYPESKVVHLDHNHATLGLVGDGRDLAIGDRTALTVGSAELTTMLHNQFMGLRNEHVECVFNREP